MVVLSSLMNPVKGRGSFIKDFFFKSGEKTVSSTTSDCSSAPTKKAWVLVDSEGEDEGESFAESPDRLKENDLIVVLNQVPLDALFRCILKIRTCDGKVTYDASNFSEASTLKLFAFATRLVGILRKGLANFSSPSYSMFCKRVGDTISQTVQHVSDHWEAFKDKLDPSVSPLWDRLQVEFDEFHLRAVMSLFSSRNSGVWQYLARIPYHTISYRSLWRILHLLCFNPSDDQRSNRGARFFNSVIS